VLDVAFGEGGSRLRKDKGPENMAILRKLAMTVTRADTGTKSSMTGRRKILFFPQFLYALYLVANRGRFLELKFFGVFQHFVFQRLDKLFSLGGDKNVVGIF
jgi:hypothetical protein